MSKAKQASTSRSHKRVWWITLLCWLLFAYLAIYWVLKGLGELDAPKVDDVPLHVEGSLERVQAAGLQEALGVSKSEPNLRVANPNDALGARLRLTGIVFEGAKRTAELHSVALLSLDQKAAKPYRVGMSLEPGLWVLSISERQVKLGPDLHGEPTVTLDLPKTTSP